MYVNMYIINAIRIKLEVKQVVILIEKLDIGFNCTLSYTHTLMIDDIYFVKTVYACI